MKKFFRRFALLLLSFVMCLQCGCMDLGEGEHETSFFDYFSAVVLISDKGLKSRKISKFNDNTDTSDGGVKEVIDKEYYSYIAFKVDKDYEFTIEDFAFFARSDGEVGTLMLEFFIADSIPTKTLDLDGEGSSYLPKFDEENMDEEGDATHADDVEEDEDGNKQDREDEVGEDMFLTPGYATGTLALSAEWNSVLLEFPVAQKVKPTQFVIVRVLNNCFTDSTHEDFAGMQAKSIKFTFNHLMFRFVEVKKV